MTIDKPGQEQWMVTLENVPKAIAHLEAGWPLVDDDQRRDVIEWLRLLARPTADLGEDGELDARLRRTEKRTVSYATNRTAPIVTKEYDALVNPDGPEAADRLILYREALDRARFWFAGYVANGGGGADEELAAIRDVLSRSA